MSAPKRRACKPHCSSLTKRTRDVIFINGTIHGQEYCLVCYKTRYVSVKENRPKFLTQVQDLAEEMSRVAKKRYGDSFYTSPPWMAVRYHALTRYGPKCHLCGSIEKPIHVDHIKPRSKYPELSLDVNNLQILCAACNYGKGADFEDDLRPKEWI